MDVSVIGDSLGRAAAVVAGIGFLIFAHELGHFLLAKFNGVRVDLFSLGFGPVICSWRKGMGLRRGSTAPEYEEKQKRLEEMQKAEREGIQQEDVHAFAEQFHALGQTEYRLSWIPLGGFVKMAGEPLGEARSGAPDELTSKTAWQRLQIFAAGPAMSFLVAFPICIAAALVGKDVTPSVLGDGPAPESAEWTAGLTQGDRVVAVNGRPVRDGESYQWEMVRAAPGEPVSLDVERGGERIQVPLVLGQKKRIPLAPPTNALADVRPGSPAARAGLQDGDVIEAVDGKPALRGPDIELAIRTGGGKPLELRVRRPGEAPRTVTVTPEAFTDADRPAAFDPHTVGGEPVVGAIHPLSRALAHLREGDRFVKIGDREIRTDREVREVVSASPETPLAFEVLRDGQTVSFTVAPRRSTTGRGVLDIGLGRDGACVVAGLSPGSPLAGAGAQEGDRVVAFDGRTDPSNEWVRKRVEESPGRTVAVVLERAGATVKADVAVGHAPLDYPKALPVIALAAFLGAVWLFGRRWPRLVRLGATLLVIGAHVGAVALLARARDASRGSLDAAFVQAQPRLLEVRPEWPLHAAGARPGDRILRVQRPGGGGFDLCRGLAHVDVVAAAGKPFALELEREGKVLPVTVAPAPLPYYTLHGGPPAWMAQTEFRRFGLREAAVRGSAEVLDMTKLTVQLLVRLVRGGEDPSGLAGPIGIFRISYSVSGHGLGKFLWFLAMITVSLAVFNLLPVPILDGGHIFFLLVEKIKGAPVTEATLIKAQYVGLALLFSLLILVTYNDIFNFLR